MPERINYWGIPHNWGPPEVYVYTIMFLAAFVMLFRFYRQASPWWKVGRPEARWDKLHLRFGRLIQYAIVQTKVLNQRYPGIMHIAIAWAYFVFFLGTALATIHDHFFDQIAGTTPTAAVSEKHLFLRHDLFLHIYNMQRRSPLKKPCMGPQAMQVYSVHRTEGTRAE